MRSIYRTFFLVLAWPVCAMAQNTNPLQAWLASDTDGFTYADDLFGTSQAGSADGTYEPGAGLETGALSVRLGPGGVGPGIGISGGWWIDFEMASAGPVDVQVSYRLIIGPDHEPNEYGEALLDIDGATHGNGPGSSLVRLNGDGDGGVEQDTGWRTETFRLNLAGGTHRLTVGAFTNQITFAGEYTRAYFDNILVTYAEGGQTEPGDAFDLMVSLSQDRSGAAPLDGQSVDGPIFVFTAPDTGVKAVTFYLDDPNRIGAPYRIESLPPFDFAGTDGAVARPFDANALAAGPHSITAVLDLTDGSTEVMTASFTVGSAVPALVADTSTFSFDLNQGQTDSATVNVSASDGSNVGYAVSDDADWLTATPATGTTPDTLTVAVDAAGLAPGNHDATIELTAGGYLPAAIDVSVKVTGSGTYDLYVSDSSDRSSARVLGNASVSGDIFVFIAPDSGVTHVEFFLDNAGMTGAPVQTERRAPFDYAGGAANSANPLDTKLLADGSHTISAKVYTNGEVSPLRADFTVSNNAPALVLDKSVVGFNLDPSQSDSATVNLSASNGASVNYTVVENADWLTGTPTDGKTPDVIRIDVATGSLSTGEYPATVTFEAAGYVPASLAVNLTVGQDDTGPKLYVSTSPDRSAPIPLDGATASGNIFVFVSPENGIDEVLFYLDDANRTGAWKQRERAAPYDFAGTGTSGAYPFNAASLSPGTHNITAVVKRSGGQEVILGGNFVVNGDVQRLQFLRDRVSFSLNEGDSGLETVDLVASDGAPVPFQITGGDTWLNVSPRNGSTPASIVLSADAGPLSPGTYSTTLTATTGTNRQPDTLEVRLVIGGTGGCGLVPCGDLLVDLPYELSFNEDHGFINDGDGQGTGFRYVEPTSRGTGYVPSNIDLRPAEGVLKLTTTAGLRDKTTNSQDNALGVGIDAPSQVTILSTSLIDPPAGSGHYEQAGLWLGIDEDNFVKLVVLSDPQGTFIECSLEVNGSRQALRRSSVLNLTGKTVELNLKVDPNTRLATPSYRIGTALPKSFIEFEVPAEILSFDAAGINPEIGTRTFGGIFASHRNGPSPLVYTFDAFSAVGVSAPPTDSGFAFDRKSFPMFKPTSMVWGPDDRLYVLELFGSIHALTYDNQYNVIDDELIDSMVNVMGQRLSLGITVDPASTADNIILWVSSSSPSLDNGKPNSGQITRLSGPGFTTVEQVITGLPRALANHATNALHFGPDGRLYIAQGGNTGAGAPNTANTEFGPMQEQPLSAAMLVADINAPGFDGSCDNTADIFGPPPCDVVTYATGLRNMYDFVFHSNGQMYGPENGLGVTGTYPPSPTPPCLGFGDVSRHYPGPQPDTLIRIEQGAYYGHPNPHRNECVFMDGTEQGVDPLPNYRSPIYNLGDSRSADGIVEYTSQAFCGGLKGDLLITSYSVGDEITRITLTADGRSVLSAESLLSGFNDPLPITTNPEGIIFVGEFGGDVVTALVPEDFGCWTSVTPMPEPVLDGRGAALDGKLYVVGGDLPTGHVRSLYIYDPAADNWSRGADLPTVGVEDPAAAVHDGKLYVFGGSTESFSGMVAHSAVYDPATDAWTVLADLPTPRSGIRAETLDGLIYVAGGLKADGSSTDIVEVYDPATDTWTTAPPMLSRRDHAGTAVLDGRLYVFGGRIREADGTVIADIMNTVEMYDPATNAWSIRTSMPTARRTMVVGKLNGKAQLMGGERTPEGGSFAENEEYDPVTDTWRVLLPMPTPRHGAAGGTIDGVVYSAGGGPEAGTSYTNVVEAFRLAR